MEDTFSHTDLTKEDASYEQTLRPQSLQEFIGQESLIERLHIATLAAKERQDPLGHTLFLGPPGLGKTTLSHIIAKTLDAQIIVTSGPAVEKPGDLAGILTNLKKGDVLFIDEIHRLNKVIEEYLYSAMEDFRLDLVIDSGPAARSVTVEISPFTLIGATTRQGLISSPLRTRFAHSFRLDFYPPPVLQRIVLRTFQHLRMNIAEDAALEIAKRARGTPRIVNNLSRWVRDVAQVQKEKNVDTELVSKALNYLSIDDLGLDEMDIRYLDLLIDSHGGGPVGIGTIAAALGEEVHSLEEVHEPFLIMKGLIKRTPRGREATSLAYHHLQKHQAF